MVLQYACKHGQIARREAVELCRISSNQASRLLARVAASHPELTMVGTKRGARYAWRGEAPPKGGKK